MIARVTLAEIDVLRGSVADGVERFRREVVPALQAQPGYQGVYLLTTPEGLALVMSFWSSEEDADAGMRSGFYAEQVQRFVTLFKAPPGRVTYDVALAEPPAQVAGAVP